MIFGQKIQKNNNAGNEFLGINTHENMIFFLKINYQTVLNAMYWGGIHHHTPRSYQYIDVAALDIIKNSPICMKLCICIYSNNILNL